MAGVRRSGDIGTRARAIACGSSTGARAHMVTHRTVHERTAKIARRGMRATSLRALRHLLRRQSAAPATASSARSRRGRGGFWHRRRSHHYEAVPCRRVMATRAPAHGSVPLFEDAPANAQTGAQPRVMLNW